jgi:1,4-dihydroxy-2-naphthoate octaprenyltransferase
MSNGLKLFGKVSRAEFLLPNLGSLIMGLAWGVSPPMRLTDLIVLIIVLFSIINLSSAIGAQANTLSDYDFDKRDPRKAPLVAALDSFGKRKLSVIMIIEFVSSLILVSLLAVFEAKPLLLVLWVLGIALGFFYSYPPVRLKSRSYLAPVALILVLAVFPVIFAFYAFSSAIGLFFLLSLVGLGVTVYAVIVPTEIRDYFEDREVGITTATVSLGLVKASVLSIILLAMGAVLTVSAFLLEFTFSQRTFLSVVLILVAAAAAFVLSKFRSLHTLCVEYARADETKSLREKIVALAAENPRWIMMVTQTYTVTSIILLLGKFLFLSGSLLL